jgi:hypothetical protein
MDEKQITSCSGELEKTTEQLEDAQQYIKELRILYAISVVVLASLIAIVIQTVTFMLTIKNFTDQDIMLYKFSLLVGPSALFLLLLHFYELFGIVKRGEKSVPLALDFMYLIYVVGALTTMIGLNAYFQRHDIASTFLTTGWWISVTILFAEVVVALVLAKFLVTMLLSPRLPHFFNQKQKKEEPVKPLPLQYRVVKPRQVYYFKKKPDVERWENQDSFVRYNK